MAQDPYGYPSAHGETGNGNAVLWCGVGALILTMFGPCLCYLPNFLAVPLGAYAIWTGSRMSRSGPEGNLALAGMITGGLGAFFSLLILFAIVAYVLFVVGLVGMGALAEGA